ncbi:phage tail tape measure protein [Pseudomonas quasicaspiana]|uniref:phage tail tape measure protein n=1 Tax=Pseudomonas quasicaspiana TaxID=2829821 RepID=UPI001E590C32|nr:phage tail tape measure protein [Pseudomonas quasicaspiana]MCD5969776.1 phage tail tape measure protein [Pseudomonas quasicaspiana]
MANNIQVMVVMTGVDKLSPQLKNAQKEISTLSKSLSALGNIPFMDTLTGKEGLMKPFVDGAKAAIAFESSMARVRRVVDFQAPEQFKAMSKDVLDLSEKLPVSAAGIAQVFALGGQSGVAREELKTFAEDALKMGIAFDQTGEQSGAMMARWRTDFKLNQTEVVALADQITQLGRAGGVDTGKVSRIVTAAGTSGLSAGQTAAMGAVFARSGMSEEAAATSMRNFTQTLTAGVLATEGQQQAFKALGLDAQAVSQGMSADAEGTISNVLTKLNALERGKQSAMLSQLFGDSSAAPLVTGLDALSRNFQLVGNSQKYAGSMQEVYAARASTTESALQLMNNQTTRLGVAIGTALLPPVNDFLGTIGPLISKVSAFTEANPGLVRSIAGAAAGFTFLRLAVVAATVASAVMSTVIGANPVGLVVRGIALAAGLLIANWSSVSGFFQEVWTTIQTSVMAAWEGITEVLSWSPLTSVKANWEPIIGLFKSIWTTIEPIISSIMAFFGGSDAVKVNTNIGGGTGQFVMANAAQLVRDEQAQRNLTQGGASVDSLLRSPDQPGAPGSLIMAGSLNQQAAANNRTNLQGALTVQFQNAPPGTTVGEAQTNQPGFSISQRGVRSLSQQ